MSIITKFKDWTASHNPKWLALVRLVLGGALLLKGVTFMNDMPELEKLINGSSFAAYTDILKYAVPWVHVVGGFLILLGLFTRFAALVQIPVLLGAVLIVPSHKGFFASSNDLSFTVIILILLIVFIIEGSGTLSLSAYFKDEDAR